MSFSITSINGKRCTAIPRSVAASSQIASVSKSSSPAAAAPVAATSTSAAPAVVVPAPVVVATSSAASVPQATSQAAAVVASTTPQAVNSQSPLARTSTPIVISTPTIANSPIVVVTSSPAAVVSAQDPLTSSTTNSPVAIVQSEVDETRSSTNEDDLLLRISTTFQRSTTTTSAVAQITSSAPVESSATEITAPASNINPGAVVGGVLGGIFVVAAITFLLWWSRKRRRNRDSLLTPLNSPPYDVTRKGFYEIDNASVGPTRRSEKLKAQTAFQFSRLREQVSDLGISIRENLAGGNNAPSVNLNRGNSQFMEAIPQHSRTPSAFTSSTRSELTTRDRLADWWQRLTADAVFNWRLKRKENDPINPYATNRGLNEKTPAAGPDFSQFLAMKDHELREAADKKRQSFAGLGSAPKQEALGLDFGNPSTNNSDPFADPNFSQPTIPDLSQPASRYQGQNSSQNPPLGSGGQVLTLNPFADPVSVPKGPPSYSRQSRPVISKPIPAAIGPGDPGYTTEFLPTIRESSRSRERMPSSRYPSTRISQDSYRSTFMSSLSGLDLRNKKGRSDPFDLERPELWRSKTPEPQVPVLVPGPAKQTTPMPTMGRNTIGSVRVVSQAQKGPTEGLLDSLAAFRSERASVRKSGGGKAVVLNMNPDQGSSSNYNGNGSNYDVEKTAGGEPTQKPRQVSMQPARVSDSGTYSSKYSSGISTSDSEWGDPGPDMGPFGLRALDEESLRSVIRRNGSIGSETSGKSNGVGKAM